MRDTINAPEQTPQFVVQDTINAPEQTPQFVVRDTIKLPDRSGSDIEVTMKDSSTRKKLLIIGAGDFQLPLVQQAAETCDVLLAAPVISEAFTPYISGRLIVDVRDEETILAFAQAHGIDGVITDQKYAVLMTANGYLLKFLIEQIPEMKKAAAGVAGIKLSKEDYVERAVLAKDKEPAPLVHRDTEIDLDKVRAGARNGRGSKRF